MNEKHRKFIEIARPDAIQMEAVVEYLCTLLDEKSVNYSLEEFRTWEQSSRAMSDPQIYDNAPVQPQNIPKERFMQIFMDYFHGRRDVYARWNESENKKAYYPVCSNFYDRELCFKSKEYRGVPRKGGCSECPNHKWVPLDSRDLDLHFRGQTLPYKKIPVRLGIYPALPDNTCYFLVFDFDAKKENESVEACRAEVNLLEQILNNLEIPYLKERSRSGKGVHVWLFFEEAIDLAIARLFGQLLLKKGSMLVDLPRFKTFDRMIPMQDSIEHGHLGNLIALPLQGQSVKEGNTVFVDENWNVLPFQRNALANTKKIPRYFIYQSLEYWKAEGLMDEYEDINGSQDEEISLFGNPSRKEAQIFHPEDVRGEVQIVRESRIRVEKYNLMPRLTSQIRSLARWKNPQYFELKAQKLPLKNIPSVYMMDEDIGDDICLPQGCLDTLISRLEEAGIAYNLQDETTLGDPIQVSFKLTLREEQESLVQKMLAHKDGIVRAATGSGKTIIGLYIIGVLQRKTLIIVPSLKIQNEWKSKISKVLKNPDGTDLTEEQIGILNGSKKKLGGIIDIALYQSLHTYPDLDEVLQRYGTVIVDECHRAAASTFAGILERVPGRYRYGMSATPYRQDGLEKSLDLQLGPIRASFTAKQQAGKQNFNRFYVPRNTPFLAEDIESCSLQECIELLCESPIRNQMILDDVREAYKSGKHILILSQRIKHVRWLYEHLSTYTDRIVMNIGGQNSAQQKAVQKKMEELKELPAGEGLILVGTASSIGEGFDFPSLDTLFLTTPYSGENSITQFAGRLHRDYPGKRKVEIYDYVDIQVPIVRGMYYKRKKIYKKLGYHEGLSDLPERDPVYQKVFRSSDWQKPLQDDMQIGKTIYIASASWKADRLVDDLNLLKPSLKNGAAVYVYLASLDAVPDYKALQMILDEFKKQSEVFDYPALRIRILDGLKDNYVIINNSLVWSGPVFGGLNKEKEGSLYLRFEDEIIAEGILQEILKDKTKNSGGLF